MIINKISFVFVVLTFITMGTTISFASDETASENTTKEVERIARRDKMIAELKAEYAAKVAVKKEEKSAKVIEKISKVTEIITENKAGFSEAAANKITEAITAEKISDVIKTAEPVESALEHGAKEAISGQIKGESSKE
jgi:flagellin-specific chaperone FliS